MRCLFTLIYKRFTADVRCCVGWRSVANDSNMQLFYMIVQCILQPFLFKQIPASKSDSDCYNKDG